MNDIYYKIGEFSKLTGVSIKSLRYYDEIGVLKPAYIDEKTNYRFYVPEQIIRLEVIRLCLCFNIPLNHAEGLQGCQVPNLKQLISKGKAMAKEQLLQAKKMIRLSDDLLMQVERLEAKRNPKEPYTYSFPKRRVIVQPWNLKSDTDKTYLQKIASLHKTAREQQLTVLTQQGILIDCSQNQAYVYISVYESGPNVWEFKEGPYSCMMIEEGKFASLPDILEKENILPQYIFCLNTDIYDFCAEQNLHMLEAQCIVR